ncbi:baseplate hub protein, partial [Yersinia similis]
NGTFVIYKLSYDISNRDTPFYHTAECRRLGLWQTLL